MIVFYVFQKRSTPKHNLTEKVATSPQEILGERGEGKRIRELVDGFEGISGPRAKFAKEIETPPLDLPKNLDEKEKLCIRFHQLACRGWPG